MEQQWVFPAERGEVAQFVEAAAQHFIVKMSGVLLCRRDHYINESDAVRRGQTVYSKTAEG